MLYLSLKAALSGVVIAEAGRKALTQTATLQRLSAWLVQRRVLLLLLGAAVLIYLLLAGSAGFAQDISDAVRAAVQRIEGPAPFAFLSLGAKHMVTGIDHILFLIGVISLLCRLRDVVIYVSMFTIGHSL